MFRKRTTHFFLWQIRSWDPLTHCSYRRRSIEEKSRRGGCRSTAFVARVGIQTWWAFMPFTNPWTLPRWSRQWFPLLRALFDRHEQGEYRKSLEEAFPLLPSLSLHRVTCMVCVTGPFHVCNTNNSPLEFSKFYIPFRKIHGIIIENLWFLYLRI